MEEKLDDIDTSADRHFLDGGEDEEKCSFSPKRSDASTQHNLSRLTEGHEESLELVLAGTVDTLVALLSSNRAEARAILDIVLTAGREKQPSFPTDAITTILPPLPYDNRAAIDNALKPVYQYFFDKFPDRAFQSPSYAPSDYTQSIDKVLAKLFDGASSTIGSSDIAIQVDEMEAPALAAPNRFRAIWDRLPTADGTITKAMQITAAMAAIVFVNKKGFELLALLSNKKGIYDTPDKVDQKLLPLMAMGVQAAYNMIPTRGGIGRYFPSPAEVLAVTALTTSALSSGHVPASFLRDMAIGIALPRIAPLIEKIPIVDKLLGGTEQAVTHAATIVSERATAAARAIRGCVRQ